MPVVARHRCEQVLKLKSHFESSVDEVKRQSRGPRLAVALLFFRASACGESPSDSATSHDSNTGGAQTSQSGGTAGKAELKPLEVAPRLAEGAGEEKESHQAATPAPVASTQMQETAAQAQETAAQRAVATSLISA
jgi:hypothetical protein